MAALALAYAVGLAVPWLAASAAVGLALVGFADDRFDLAPVIRLGAQVAAGALMGIAAGSGWLVAAGALIAPIVVNVVNFMDGINGITGLSAAVWGATAWLAGLAANAETLWIIGATTVGAALGFLPWNAPSARLFLGDVGSYLFGALIAAGIVVGLAREASPLILVAPLTLYLADTGTVLIRRARRGDPLMVAHREHAYQRLAAEPAVNHLTVALLVATLAGAITMAWSTLTLFSAASLTLALVAGYLGSPLILKRWRTVAEVRR
jgi:UDP-N-acetylmuramyl pentapeptide phosphotransferase/UDP-N-acetylglucosamine-1-phosphate transferase